EGRVACGGESVAAVAGGVGNSVEDGDSHAAAGVAGGRRIKGPSAGALNGLVSRAGDRWLGGVTHGDRLNAIGAVAAQIGGSPSARDDLCAAATVSRGITEGQACHAAVVLSDGHACDVGPSIGWAFQH